MKKSDDLALLGDILDAILFFTSEKVPILLTKKCPL